VEEADQMLTAIPEDLPSRVEQALNAGQMDACDGAIERYADAQHELDCYLLYFEGVANRYQMWLRHVESSAPPDMPKKLGDETWSRMSITQRTEYELSVTKAQECLNMFVSTLPLCTCKCMK